MTEPTAAPREKRINVVQGTYHVSADPSVMMTTVLGSCIACCLFDAQARVGGMNHFLLAEPGQNAERARAEAERYGIFAMELLVNEMLKAGAVRSQLRGHLYGGANLHAGMRPIGTSNAEFARQFLENDRIPLIHSNVGGSAARRVDFRPALGRARCRLVDGDASIDMRRQGPVERSGVVELF